MAARTNRKRPRDHLAPAPSSPLERNVKATARRFVFKAADLTYGVLVADREGASPREEVRMVGPVCDVQIGETVQAAGKWTQNTQHGWQFRVFDHKVTRSTEPQAIISYLADSKTADDRPVFPGIGRKVAERIVDAFGEDTLRVIDEEPHRLLDVKGITQRTIDKIGKNAEGERAHRRIMLYLRRFQVSTGLANKLYKRYGEQTISKLEANPYLVTEIDRIGFKIADQLAVSLGLPMKDPRRIDAGITYVLQNAADRGGHCYLPLADLLTDLCDALDLQGDDDIRLAADRVIALAQARKIIQEPSSTGERRIYHPRYWRHEQRVVHKIRAMLESASTIDLDLPAHKRDVAGFTPTDEQWAALHMVQRHPLSILTGGPGVGKTATTRMLTTVLHEAGAPAAGSRGGSAPNRRALTFAMCAPTGKAAKRIRELTGEDARTIHRLLGWNPRERAFEHDASNPLCAADGSKLDVLIVDEVSMIDLAMFDRLLQAVDQGTHVLLIGDPDQLPSVGPGKVLSDLLLTRMVPVTRLTKIHRQAAKSMIIQAAYAINRGESPSDDHEQLSERFGFEMDRDFYFMPRSGRRLPDPDDPTGTKTVEDQADANRRMLETALYVATERIPRSFGLDPFNDIQIIIPQHGGPAGIDVANQAMQARLNPRGIPVGNSRMRVGDRVVCLENDYDNMVMNGEMGRIVDYNPDRHVAVVEVDDRQIEIGESDLNGSYRLSYAMSVHKMQGSSAKAVVLVLSNSHHMMLTKPLLYTAVTRPEKLLVIVGQPRALAVAARTEDTRKRNTSIADRLLNPSVGGRLL